MEKIKYFIFGMIVCFIIFVITGIVFNIIGLNNKIYVKTLDNFDTNIEAIDSHIDHVNVDDVCKDSLKELSNRVKETYYKNDVTISEYNDNYFKDNFTFYSLYIDVTNSCDIDRKTYSYIDEYAIESQSYPQEVHTRVLSNYEIKFSDNIGTYSNKMLELRVLNELLGVIDPIMTFN